MKTTEVLNIVQNADPEKIGCFVEIAGITNGKHNSRITMLADKTSGAALAKQSVIGPVTHYAVLCVVEKEAFDKANEAGVLQRHSEDLTLLEKFCKYLEEANYLDTDWRTETPTAIDQFILVTNAQNKDKV